MAWHRVGASAPVQRPLPRVPREIGLTPSAVAFGRHRPDALNATCAAAVDRVTVVEHRRGRWARPRIVTMLATPGGGIVPLGFGRQPSPVPCAECERTVPVQAVHGLALVALRSVCPRL